MILDRNKIVKMERKKFELKERTLEGKRRKFYKEMMDKIKKEKQEELV